MPAQRFQACSRIFAVSDVSTQWSMTAFGVGKPYPGGMGFGVICAIAPVPTRHPATNRADAKLRDENGNLMSPPR